MKICSHRNYVVTGPGAGIGTHYDLWCKDCGAISKMFYRQSGIWARQWRAPSISRNPKVKP